MTILTCHRCPPMLILFFATAILATPSVIQCEGRNYLIFGEEAKQNYYSAVQLCATLDTSLANLRTLDQINCVSPYIETESYIQGYNQINLNMFGFDYVPVLKQNGRMRSIQFLFLVARGEAELGFICQSFVTPLPLKKNQRNHHDSKRRKRRIRCEKQCTSPKEGPEEIAKIKPKKTSSRHQTDSSHGNRKLNKRTYSPDPRRKSEVQKNFSKYSIE